MVSKPADRIGKANAWQDSAEREWGLAVSGMLVAVRILRRKARPSGRTGRDQVENGEGDDKADD